MSAVNDPLVSTGHILDYRYQKDASAGVQINLRVSLYQGGTEIAFNQHNDIPNGWTAGQIALTGTQANSITNYADLRVVLTPSSTGGGAGRTAQVSWVEFKVPDAPATSHNINVSEQVNGADSHTLTRTIPITASEQVNGNDSSSVVNAGTVHNITISELNEGSDSHSFVNTLNFIVSEIVNGTDTSTVNVLSIWNITASETVNGNDGHTYVLDQIYQPTGQYIWFKVSPPTANRLGGVFAESCSSGFYVEGIDTDGHLICTALP